ncbi:GDP-mannose 4,6-dehydratase [Aerococcus urinaeequi]
MKKILVTGAAGFVGSFLCKSLVDKEFRIYGLDNINDYYDTTLKQDRLKPLLSHKNFTFIKGDISDKSFILKLFSENKFDIVVNLAAQAGVRYSIDSPDTYIQSNIIGFFNILEACRNFPVEHLLYASSSSVYGSNKKVPFDESDNVDNPVSLYAATKKSNELMAHTYSHLYGIPSSGLRFFTVYGPQGRPDMAYFKFTDMYFTNKPIYIYNNGDMANDLYRDFTFIDDVVDGIVKLIEYPPIKKDNDTAHEIYNIGNSKPEKLMIFITSLEKALSNSLGRDIEFKKIFEPIKPGDVPATYASTKKLQKTIGFKPDTTINEGLQQFTDWYVKYYNKK